MYLFRSHTFKLGILTLTSFAQWYISVIREQTQRDMMARPFTERSKFQEMQTDLYWGFFWADLNYPQGPQFDCMTLAEAANREFSAMERILARALPAN